MISTLPLPEILVSPNKASVNYSNDGATFTAEVVGIEQFWLVQLIAVWVSALDKDGNRVGAFKTYDNQSKITVNVNSLDWSTEPDKVTSLLIQVYLEEVPSGSLTVIPIADDVTVRVSGGGTRSGYIGSLVSFTVSCNVPANREFLYWDGTDIVTSYSQSYTFQLFIRSGSDTVYVYAHTKAKPTYKITVMATVDDKGGGTATPYSETQTGVPGDHKNFYIEATADEGYLFFNWTKDDGTVFSTSSRTLYQGTITNEDQYVTFYAHFKKQEPEPTTHTVTVITLAKIDDETYSDYTLPIREQKTGNIGDLVTFNLTTWKPDDNPYGYHFLGWYESSTKLSKDKNYSYIVEIKDKDEEHTIIAVYRGLTGLILCNSEGRIIYQNENDKIIADYLTS